MSAADLDPIFFGEYCEGLRCTGTTDLDSKSNRFRVVHIDMDPFQVPSCSFHSLPWDFCCQKLVTPWLPGVNDSPNGLLSTYSATGLPVDLSDNNPSGGDVMGNMGIPGSSKKHSSQTTWILANQLDTPCPPIETLCKGSAWRSLKKRK